MFKGAKDVVVYMELVKSHLAEMPYEDVLSLMTPEKNEVVGWFRAKTEKLIWSDKILATAFYLVSGLIDFNRLIDRMSYKEFYDMVFGTHTTCQDDDWKEVQIVMMYIFGGVLHTRVGIPWSFVRGSIVS